MSLPDYASGANHIEMTVYETDRDNVGREPLAYITSAVPDWDIDRAGSKGRLSIASHRRVFRDGMWVATHIRIVPEVGDIVDMQTGHFRLDVPAAEFDGSIGMDGVEKVLQDVIGNDIVDVLAKAQLPFTFATPVGGHIMSDVAYLIKLATMGAIGKNLAVNGGFESGIPPWFVGLSHTGVGSVITSRSPVAEGVQSANFLFEPGRTINQYLQLRQEIAIPTDAQYLLVSGIANMMTGFHQCTMVYEWLDSSKAVIGSAITIDTGNRYQQWKRHFAIATPPQNAVWLNLRLRVGITGSIATASSSRWDDIQVRSITTLPIPDNRINLPRSDTVATTRIQTTGGASIGTTAINADRLTAISHHAINATFEGVLTTSPSRSLGDGTAARTYNADDWPWRKPPAIRPSANNRYNTVVAVKESFDGTPPLSVTVWNNDPDDDWSVQTLGNVGPPGGMPPVQDAVDLAALEAAARAYLARATMQEDLVIRVEPDSELSVYDVINIDGGPAELQGRWLIQALSGVTKQTPYTEIHARRSRTSVGVTYG